MKSSRLLSILLLLQTRGRMTADQLAAELEVSPRTVYRDVESLHAAGIPLYGDAGHRGGYRLLAGYRTRLTGLSPDEAEALFLSGMPGPAAELGLGPALAAAQLKLSAALPPELRAQADRMRSRFHLDAPGWFAPQDEVPFLPQVADAVWHSRVLDVRYRRREEPTDVDRRLEPYGLVLKAGRWYAVARPVRPAPARPEPPTGSRPEAPAGSRTEARAETAAGSRTEAPTGSRTGPTTQPTEQQPEQPAPPAAEAGPRTYRVDQILALSTSDEVFAPPPGFDLAAYWRRHEADFYARLHRSEAEILVVPEAASRLGAAAARAVADAGPPQPDGRIRAVVPVESADQALSTFLSLGTDVEVLAPPELRTRLAATARALAERYGGS